MRAGPFNADLNNPGDESGANVTYLTNGNFVVVHSTPPIVPGQPGRNIYCVIYDAQGNRLHLVGLSGDSLFGYVLEAPSVAPTNDGGFIVAYEQNGADGTTIAAERFSADGTSVDSRLIQTPVDGAQWSRPVIAVDLSDNSSVITTERRVGETDTIQSFALDPDMTPLPTLHRTLRADEDPTDTLPNGDPGGNDTVLLSNGASVTVYNEGDNVLGVRRETVEFRIIKPNGDLGATAKVSDIAANANDPKVAALEDGGFVITWSRADAAGGDDIVFRVYEANGTPRTGIITAHESSNDLVRPDVIGLEDGTVFIAWETLQGGDIRGRLFDAATGAQIGGVTPIELEGTARDVSLGTTTDGRILATYTSTDLGGVTRTVILDGRDSVIFAEPGDGQITSRVDGGVVVGSAAAETVYGGAGNDTFRFDETAIVPGIVDDFDGGGGINTFEVKALAEQSLVDLLTGQFSLGNLDGGVVTAGTLIALLDNVVNVTVRGLQDIRGDEGVNVLAATGNFANVIDGLGGNDTIGGGDGNDTLYGGTGVDWMTGGNGNDIYTVDAKGDQTIEVDGGGIDTVFSLVSRTLGTALENLVLAGTAVTAIGNGLANALLGNDGNNTLQSLDGNDTLTGGDGDDDLRGGAGADSMNGGDGNDRYFVDDDGDLTIETNASFATGGIDTVFSTINHTLGAYLENLRLQGTGNLNGRGNEIGNKIYGTTGANLLQGLGGNDELTGNDGADTLAGGEGNDTLIGGSQADVFRFSTVNAGADTIRDFNKNADRFDLGGGSFTQLTVAPDGDVILTHNGGTIRIDAPLHNLTLAQYNALVLPGGAAASLDESGHQAPSWSALIDLAVRARGELLHLGHGDWVFA